MTKKEFIALADMIRGWNSNTKASSVPSFHLAQLNALADFCQSTNPNFQRERWLDYIAGKCGPSGGKPK